MFGFYPFGAAAFASLGDRVHVLSVSEGAGCVADGRSALGMALHILVNTAGASQESGPNANGSSLRELADSAGTTYAVHEVPLSSVEENATEEATAASFGSVPLHIVETSSAEAQPPFMRQRWEFIKTSTGGQWLLVRTGE